MQETAQNEGEQVAAGGNIDLSNLETHKTLIESGRIELISHERLVFMKPIAIIINPNSGKKRDLSAMIKMRLD